MHYGHLSIKAYTQVYQDISYMYFKLISFWRMQTKMTTILCFKSFKNDYESIGKKPKGIYACNRVHAIEKVLKLIQK